MLDVTRLRVFRAVVNAGSVQAAATNLGYSASAVSQHITTLQRETGLTLFEKSGRGITATATGLALAASSEEVMTSLGRVQSVVEDLRDGRTGSLAIGTFPSAGQYLMPHVARMLSDEFPDVVLRLDLVDLDEHVDGGYDIDIRVEDPLEHPTSLPGYHRVALWEEPYTLVLPRDHPLVDKQPLLLSDVAQHRLIEEGAKGSMCARILGRGWAASGVSPRYVARVSEHHAAIALVAAGVGITMIPQLAVGRLPATLVARQVADEVQPRRRLVAFVRQESASTAVSQRAMALLRELAASPQDALAAAISE